VSGETTVLTWASPRRICRQVRARPARGRQLRVPRVPPTRAPLRGLGFVGTESWPLRIFRSKFDLGVYRVSDRRVLIGGVALEGKSGSDWGSLDAGLLNN
jgi:hypothetical protein